MIEEEICYGKRCTANEHCCPGSVCVDVDGGEHNRKRKLSLTKGHKPFSQGMRQHVRIIAITFSQFKRKKVGIKDIERRSCIEGKIKILELFYWKSKQCMT